MPTAGTVNRPARSTRVCPECVAVTAAPFTIHCCLLNYFLLVPHLAPSRASDELPAPEAKIKHRVDDSAGKANGRGVEHNRTQTWSRSVIEPARRAPPGFCTRRQVTWAVPYQQVRAQFPALRVVPYHRFFDTWPNETIGVVNRPIIWRNFGLDYERAVLTAPNALQMRQCASCFSPCLSPPLTFPSTTLLPSDGFIPETRCSSDH